MNPTPIRTSPAAHAGSAAAGVRNDTQSRKLRESTEQFEAVLLRQILTSAQKPLLAKPLFGKSPGDDIVRDLKTERMAEQISRTGSVGLARYLETTLRKNPSHPSADAVRATLKP
jgi:Rod binding domain-containing protein